MKRPALLANSRHRIYFRSANHARANEARTSSSTGKTRDTRREKAHARGRHSNALEICRRGIHQRR